MAGRIAQGLANAGTEVIIATPQDEFHFSSDDEAAVRSHEALIRRLPATIIDGCRGTVGNFQVRMSQRKGNAICQVERIILCEDLRREPGFALYGLEPSPHIVSLSQASAYVKQEGPSAAIPAPYQKAVFLMGLNKESHPVIAGEVMESALLLQRQGIQTYILTGNLKVAAPGLEKRYRESRKSGVVFIKFSQTTPAIVRKPDGRVLIEYEDEILNQRLRLSPDLTIVDETLAPSTYLRHLIRIFELEADASGFAQADNVHRMTLKTNRRGILAAGPSRSILSAEERRIDAGNAVLHAGASLQDTHCRGISFAEIDPGKCVRCLTCYRLCPYRAVVVNARPRIEPEACESCGICIAECPREAIHFRGSAETIAQTAARPPAESTEKALFFPAITAFCCIRSAAQAKKLAARMACSLPTGLTCIEVPCAGSISRHQLLNAFRDNADGVLVLTCHTGNCHSEDGCRMAANRVDHLKAIMDQIGFEPERLMIQTLASNMGRDFSRIAEAFEEQLKALGPSSLKAENH